MKRKRPEHRDFIFIEMDRNISKNPPNSNLSHKFQFTTAEKVPQESQKAKTEDTEQMEQWL